MRTFLAYAVLSIGLVGTTCVYAQGNFSATTSSTAVGIDWQERSENPQLRARVSEKIARFSDAELAGAVLMPSFEKGMKAEVFGKLLCDIRARSYILLRSDTSKALTQSIQKAYTKACPHTTTTLMVALDAEPSLMKYRMPAIKVPNTILLTDTQKSAEAGKTIARALADAGIYFNFAPVYDTGPNKEVIGNRSFGTFESDPMLRANAFAQATWEAQVIPTAKHFPGHGQVKGDSHVQPVWTSGEYGIPEVAQFLSAVQFGVPVVMVGHIEIRAGAHDSKGLPSTLSSVVMTGLLRNSLGFKGLIVTDSMAMGALNKYSDRSVRALKAGADVVVIPPDPKAAHARVLQELKANKKFRERVTDAVFRAELLYAVRAEL